MKAEAPSSQQAATSTDDYVRLHISPLDADLVKIIVPAAVLPQARNISYHTIETFPEKRYGYVDLPQMDADKIKRKLHGAVLKGVKVRVEKARPEAVPEPAGDESKKKRKAAASEDGEAKKRKRDRNVVEGVVLKDRKVKRGWTESADTKRRSKDKDKDKDKTKEKRNRPKSVYTEQDECLLKTKLPPNAVSEQDPHKKKKKKGNARDVTVHEFEKTTKFPSFLKNTVPGAKDKPAAEFVDGKGWVDADGNVVEAAPPERPKRKKKAAAPPPESESEDTSSSGSSTSSSDDSDSEVEETPSRKERPMSSSSSRSLTIKIPSPATPGKEVHPLEALYKRHNTETPAQTGAAEPFSFFAEGNDDIEEDEGPDKPPTLIAMPMTPYTRQEFEWRNVRSAAPTPDTAHPSRMKNFWAPDDAGDGVQEEDEEDEGEKDEPQPASSDFQSWFWENRRDLNRSWMTRRKTAAKEKRHRDNKSRASKAV